MRAIHQRESPYESSSHVYSSECPVISLIIRVYVELLKDQSILFVRSASIHLLELHYIRNYYIEELGFGSISVPSESLVKFKQISIMYNSLLPPASDASLFEIDYLFYRLPATPVPENISESTKCQMMKKSTLLNYFKAYYISIPYIKDQTVDKIFLQMIEHISHDVFDSISGYKFVSKCLNALLEPRYLFNVVMALKIFKVAFTKNVYFLDREFLKEDNLVKAVFLKKLTNIPQCKRPENRRITLWIARQAKGMDQGKTLMAFISPTVKDPVFDSYLSRVTTTEGKEASLPCSVDNLNKLKVVWLDSNSVTLTLGERRIVDDTRFSISRPQQSSWNLIIKDARSTDAGRYLCAVNTQPVKNKMVELTVKVPAKILDSTSSKDQIVREGSDISIACRTSGVPRPIVTWVRKWVLINDVQKDYTDPHSCVYIGSSPLMGGVILSNPEEHILGTGEFLTILNISRSCSDVYECVAQNEIMPAVSRLIRIQVEFAPEISPISRKISQAIGRETILECEARAFPHAINYWEKGGNRLKNSEKYRIEAYNGAMADLLVLSLRIFNLEKKDFGAYNCIAANSLGNDKATVLLEEYELTNNHQSSSTGRTANEILKNLQNKFVTLTADLLSSSTTPQKMKPQGNYQPRSTAESKPANFRATAGSLSQGFLKHHLISNAAPQTSLFVVLIFGPLSWTSVVLHNLHDMLHA